MTAQVNGTRNYIYLSGQITNYINGAPIPDHQIYITADSSSNSGFTYYATSKTDVNGFYYDTIETNIQDGSLLLYLYDFSNNKHEAVYYYRFFWDDEYAMIADFQIYDPNSNNTFQANFTAVPDPVIEDPLRMAFKDISVGFQIKAWWWDFGDGEYSDLQHPTHIFPAPGLYVVKLTIASMPAQYECNKVSTITKHVMVGGQEYYHLGGHVFAEYFPIDFGLAYLYMYDEEDKLIPVDTVPIDTLGYYYFYQLVEGKYLTKARLASQSYLYGKFIPTYFGNEYVWQFGEDIILGSDNWECDINLIPSIESYSGDGEIIGQIHYDTTRSSSSILPAGDVEIVLLDNAGHGLNCSLSDLEGFFRFENLDYGTYQIYPDVTGIPTSPMFVTLWEGNPTATDFSLVIYQQEVTFSINEPQSEYLEEAAFIYPNPAFSQARVAVKMKKGSTLSLSLIDISGRSVLAKTYSLDKGQQEILMDLSGIPGGIYQVVLIPEDRVKITNKLLKIN